MEAQTARSGRRRRDQKNGRVGEGKAVWPSSEKEKKRGKHRSSKSLFWSLTKERRCST